MVVRNLIFFLSLILVCPLASVASELRNIGRSRIGIAVPYLAQLEPLAMADPVARLVFDNIAHSLVKIEGSGVVNDLAVRYSSTDEDRSWSVVLPRGITFADGSSLRGDSVVQSYRFLIQRANSLLESSVALPKGIAEQLLHQLANVKEVSSMVVEVGSSRPIEEEVVTFELKREDKEFYRTFALPILDMRIVATFEEQKLLGTNIAALGPFALSANISGQAVTLSKVESYFKSGFPQLSTIDIRETVDADQALSALRVGAVDIILLPTAKILAQVERDPTLIAIDSPLNNMRYGSSVWQTSRTYWSDSGNADDKLMTDKIVVRKSLLLDSPALTRLDLSHVYLP